MLHAAGLPDDVAALTAMLIAAQAREAAKDSAMASKDERIERPEKLVAAFGRKFEKTDPDQFDLALEDLETAMAVIYAEDEADTQAANRFAKPRAINRGSLPKHLPRVEEGDRAGQPRLRCGGCLHCIGDDVSERLDVVPAQFRVIVTRHPKYAGVDGPNGIKKCQSESLDLEHRGPFVDKIIRVGIDTSKSIFQLHGVNTAEKPVLRKKLRRKEMVDFFTKCPPTVIAIEACDASHHWARLLTSLRCGSYR